MTSARTTSRPAAAALAAFIVALLLLAGQAGAEPAGVDYSVDSDAWTGLSEFVALAEEQGVELTVADELDYSRLEPDDVVIFVYPTQGIEIGNLAQFVVDGGRVIIADDYGASGAFLDRLDVSLLRVGMTNLPHETYVAENPALPLFQPRGQHALLEGVDTVVANHPAVLLNIGAPVVPYDEDGGLVYDMNLGKGKALVVGDASLLINHMLAVADNRQLASNLLAYACADQQPCQATLLVRDFDQFGRYEKQSADDDDDLSELVDGFNDKLDQWMQALPTRRLFYYLGILLAAGLALYLAAVFPVRASRPYSLYIKRGTEGIPQPQSEFDWNLSRFGSGGRETNYALPLAILKEVFEELFLRKLGYWEVAPVDRPSISELAREFRLNCAPHVTDAEAQGLEAEVGELLATFARIPTRHRVFLDSDAYFSERDLIRIYRRAMRVMKAMGLEEAYERRTGSLV